MTSTPSMSIAHFLGEFTTITFFMISVQKRRVLKSWGNRRNWTQIRTKGMQPKHGLYANERNNPSDFRQENGILAHLARVKSWLLISIVIATFVQQYIVIQSILYQLAKIGWLGVRVVIRDIGSAKYRWKRFPDFGFPWLVVARQGSFQLEFRKLKTCCVSATSWPSALTCDRERACFDYFLSNVTPLFNSYFINPIFFAIKMSVNVKSPQLSLKSLSWKCNTSS